jgi:hypothetical protein
VRIGTVKSSQVLGDTNSTNVANTEVISDKTKADSKEMFSLIIGFATPNNVNAIKQRINPLIKNVKDPSNVRFELVHGNLIEILPYRFPITEANVSEMIINNIPATGKYI